MKKNKNINLPGNITKDLEDNENVAIKLGILKTYENSLKDELAEHRHQDNSKTKSLLEKTNEKIFDIVYVEYLDNIQKNSNTIKTKALNRSEFEKKFRKSEFDTNPVALNAVILRYGKTILEQNSKISEVTLENERRASETQRNSSQNPISYFASFLSNAPTQINSFASEVSEIFKIPPHQPQKHLSQPEPKNIWGSGVFNLGRALSFNLFSSSRDADKTPQNKNESQKTRMPNPNITEKEVPEKKIVGNEITKTPSSSPQSSSFSSQDNKNIEVAYFGKFDKDSPLTRHALQTQKMGQFRLILSEQQTKNLQQNVRNKDGSRRIGG